MMLIAVFLVLVIGGSIFAVRKTYESNLRPVSDSQKSHLVTIPLGSSVKEIAVILKKADLIRSTWAFEWYIRNHNLREELKAGTYSLHPNLNVSEIAEVLTQGKIDTALVTILPAQRIDQIRDALINKYQFNASDVDAALNPALYIDHPALVDKPRNASLEGYLYPESFQKTATTKPETIIRASLDQMHKYLTPEIRAGIVKQGLNVHQGVILASIIEQEVTKPEDKKQVAQVFLKRLREGKMLESDATAGYGAILEGKKESLTYDSPYNTYKHTGLTPGPISNVGKASLESVANPASTDYLYFVSGDPDDKGNSTTYFSKTLEEHQAFTRQYCKKQCSL